MTKCPVCKTELIRGITGAWFVALGEETLQINYCPECGKMLDDAGAAEVSDRIRAEQQPEAKQP